jgi:hypothetical protein
MNRLEKLLLIKIAMNKKNKRRLGIGIGGGVVVGSVVLRSLVRHLLARGIDKEVIKAVYKHAPEFKKTGFPLVPTLDKNTIDLFKDWKNKKAIARKWTENLKRED